MIYHYATSDLPGHQQLEFWNEVICRQFTELECRAGSGRAYSGSLSTWDMQGLQISMVSAEASSVIHTKKLVSATREDTYLMHLQVAGTSLNQQDGKQARLAPGDFTFCTSTQPYSLRFDHSIEMLVVKIPAPLLQKYALITNTDFLGAHFSGSDPIAASLSTLIQTTWHSADRFQKEQTLSNRMSESVLSLLAVQLELQGGTRYAEASLSANQSVLLMRAKRFVQDNLFDVNLRPSTVATALGISDRYLRLLMQREGHTCASYILDERLGRVAAALLKTGSQRFTVAELAYRWGFGSQSYFTRAFRKKFGMTPTEYRQHARH